MRIRVLHIGYLFTVGGAETMLVDIINRQVEFADVALCIINDKLSYPLLDTLDPRVKKILIKREEGSRNPFKFIQLNWEIYRFHPDIIHVHQDIIAKVLFGTFKPKLLTVHDAGTQSQCMDKYKAISAISKSVQKDLETRLNRESVLIYNGINVDLVRQREFTPIDRNTVFRVLQVSRLEHSIKGQDILIRTLSRIIQDVPEIHISLDFIGTGSSEEYLQKLCVECDVTDHVRFLGEKDRTYVYEHIADYHLLVQPSRFEGFGLTVVEGLAAKIPVLSSDNGGPEEILQSGKYGFLFKNGDIEDCCSQLKEIYNRYNSLEPFLESGHEYAKENFDVRKAAQEYLNLYKKLTNL